MIKILFFIETLGGGGAEKVLCDLVNHMDRSKFDITVQTLWPSEGRNRLAQWIKHKSVYRNNGRLNQYRMRLESALGLVYPLHMKGDYDIEVAYLECGTTKILSSSTNKRAAKIAWVHCNMDVQMANDLDGFVKKASKYYKKYDRVVCVSEDSLNSFMRLFGETPPASVLYNTIDDTAVTEQAKLPLPDSVIKRRMTAVAVGRLTHIKAYDRLLQVHKRLINEGIEYDLWIAGEGEDRKKLEAFIEENGLKDSVRLLGFQSNPYPFINAADLLVCSSRSEGFSTFVAEGLILGKPIVTTECSGMRELLGDSDYGLITDNSAEGLYEGMKRCLSDPALISKIEQKAKARAELFAASVLTKRTERFFEEIYEE
jgi:glycosyltransferase involved in cell wall biosynthesis